MTQSHSLPPSSPSDSPCYPLSVHCHTYNICSIPGEDQLPLASEMPPCDQRSEHTVKVASHYCLYSPLDDHNPVIAGYTANYLMQQLNEGDSYHPHPNKIKHCFRNAKVHPFQITLWVLGKASLIV